MTKTAYARHRRPTDEEIAELTQGMSPEDREETRIELIISPLFDLWLRFERSFARRAIDQLDISDEDAETAAKKMEAGNTTSGAAFAHLLRQIANERLVRQLFYKVEAVWAAAGTEEPLSVEAIHERYEKLPKGEA